MHTDPDHEGNGRHAAEQIVRVPDEIVRLIKYAVEMNGDHIVHSAKDKQHFEKQRFGLVCLLS